MKEDEKKKARAVLYGVLAYVVIVSCCIGILAWRLLAVPFLDALDAGAPWATAVTVALVLGTLVAASRVRL